MSETQRHGRIVHPDGTATAIVCRPAIASSPGHLTAFFMSGGKARMTRRDTLRIDVLGAGESLSIDVDEDAP